MRAPMIAALLTLLTALTPPASAGNSKALASLTPGMPACSQGWTSLPYLACAGSFGGNLSGKLSTAQLDLIDREFAPYGFDAGAGLSYSKTDLAGNGLFSDDGRDFSLDFDAGFKAAGLFVIGLKQADRYSLYLFDGGSQGVGTILFDVAGVVGQQTGGFSHAAYLGPALTPVPEPGAFSLWLAGLSALAFMARRRPPP